MMLCWYGPRVNQTRAVSAQRSRVKVFVIGAPVRLPKSYRPQDSSQRCLHPIGGMNSGFSRSKISTARCAKGYIPVGKRKRRRLVFSFDIKSEAGSQFNVCKEYNQNSLCIINQVSMHQRLSDKDVICAKKI